MTRRDIGRIKEEFQSASTNSTLAHKRRSPSKLVLSGRVDVKYYIYKLKLRTRPYIGAHCTYLNFATKACSSFLATPPTSQDFFSSLFISSAFTLICAPASPRIESRTSRISAAMAACVPFGVRPPSLCIGFSPSPLRTSISSKPTPRLIDVCTDVTTWSPSMGQHILRSAVK